MEYDKLRDAIDQLHIQGASVRFNCNLIKGHIDSKDKISEYIDFAKEMKADSVRFAELKADKENFIDVAKVLDYQYGLNDDPFTLGCHQNTIINEMPVNFRQMCGLQTELRVKPEHPEQPYDKSVLYYDGHIYQGWTRDRRFNMNSNDLKKILDNVSNGSMTSDEALTAIYRAKDEDNGYGCQY